MREALQRAWLHRGPLAWLLLPLSLVYEGVVALRRWLYAAGVFRSTRLPVPVVVVGNVVAGGAGKTPVVIELVAHLRARGVQAGVVSRGYGRRGTACVEVTPASDAAEVGDEPLLVRRRSGAPVFVGRDRAAAAAALLAAHPATQVVLSDDGLQHTRLARDIEICVFDDRGVGNGWLLPAGPLRERWPRRVDFALAHGAPKSVDALPLRRLLPPWAYHADGTRARLVDLPPPITAVAGIARPQPFFDMLAAAGLKVDRTRAFADHHDFAAPLPEAASSTLVCTEKDAVKLWRLHPQAWAVPLVVELDDAFWPAFDRLLDAKLSSTHGSETA